MLAWKSVLGLDFPPPAKNGGALLVSQEVFKREAA